MCLTDSQNQLPENRQLTEYFVGTIHALLAYLHHVSKMDISEDELTEHHFIVLKTLVRLHEVVHFKFRLIQVDLTVNDSMLCVTNRLGRTQLTW